MSTRSLLAALGLLTAACARSVDEPPAPRITNVRLSPSPAIAGQPLRVMFEAEGAGYEDLEVTLRESPHAGGCLEFVNGTGLRSCDPYWSTVLGYAIYSSGGGRTVSIPYVVHRATTATIDVRMTDGIGGQVVQQTITVAVAR
jgi:hypothetical protein